MGARGEQPIRSLAHRTTFRRRFGHLLARGRRLARFRPTFRTLPCDKLGPGWRMPTFSRRFLQIVACLSLVMGNPWGTRWVGAARRAPLLSRGQGRIAQRPRAGSHRPGQLRPGPGCAGRKRSADRYPPADRGLPAVAASRGCSITWGGSPATRADAPCLRSVSSLSRRSQPRARRSGRKARREGHRKSATPERQPRHSI